MTLFTFKKYKENIKILLRNAVIPLLFKTDYYKPEYTQYNGQHKCEPYPVGFSFQPGEIKKQTNTAQQHLDNKKNMNYPVQPDGTSGEYRPAGCHPRMSGICNRKQYKY
jgi:hypothetical protein